MPFNNRSIEEQQATLSQGEPLDYSWLETIKRGLATGTEMPDAGIKPEDVIGVSGGINAVKGVVPKTPGMVAQGLQKIRALMGGDRAAQKAGNTILNPQTMGEVEQVLKETPGATVYTPEQLAQNELYKKMGLEELTPAQMYPKVGNEPAPVQYAEAFLNAKDPAMYNKMQQQQQSRQKLIDEYKALGMENPEQAGVAIKEAVEKAAQKAGAAKGEAVEKIAKNPIRQKDVLEKAPEYGGFLDNQKAAYDAFETEYLGASTYQDLDNLNKRMGKITRQQGFDDADFSRGLKHIKSKAKDEIVQGMKDIGVVNPAENYEIYAASKEILGDYAGGGEVGEAIKTIKKITRSGEDTDHFIKAMNKIGAPEAVTVVKEQYLSDLFNRPNWTQDWQKMKKGDVYKKLLTEDQINKLDTIALHEKQAKSTWTSNVNPSRSGVFSKVAESVSLNPVATAKNLAFVMKDEMQKARVMSKFKDTQGVGFNLKGKLKKAAIGAGVTAGVIGGAVGVNKLASKNETTPSKQPDDVWTKFKKESGYDTRDKPNKIEDWESFKKSLRE